MGESQIESDSRTAYELLSNANLGAGAVVAIGHVELHIRRESHAPEQVTAYRYDPNGDHDGPPNTVILRHDTREVELENRALDRDNDTIIASVSPVTDSDTVRVVESADADPDKSGFNSTGFESAAEVDR